MAEKEEEIKEAIETLEEISSDEEKERIAELRQKYIMDRKSEMRTAIEKGIKEGIKERNVEIAKRLKKKGMAAKEIAEITELSEDDINKL